MAEWCAHPGRDVYRLLDTAKWTRAVFAFSQAGNEPVGSSRVESIRATNADTITDPVRQEDSRDTWANYNARLQCLSMDLRLRNLQHLKRLSFARDTRSSESLDTRGVES
jgi:hypothetical protein